MGKGIFTTSGHFLVMRGVTADGKILVADPASKRKSEKDWELQIFLNEARKGAAAGGSFWICDYNSEL
jgi:predicted double-glycine peptidase